MKPQILFFELSDTMGIKESLETQGAEVHAVNWEDALSYLDPVDTVQAQGYYAIIVAEANTLSSRMFLLSSLVSSFVGTGINCPIIALSTSPPRNAALPHNGFHFPLSLSQNGKYGVTNSVLEEIAQRLGIEQEPSSLAHRRTQLLLGNASPRLTEEEETYIGQILKRTKRNNQSINLTEMAPKLGITRAQLYNVACSTQISTTHTRTRPDRRRRDTTLPATTRSPA